MMGAVPGNGHWVRTKDATSAQAFVDEQQMRANDENERKLRARASRRRMWQKFRAMFRRSS